MSKSNVQFAREIFIASHGASVTPPGGAAVADYALGAERRLGTAVLLQGIKDYRLDRTAQAQFARVLVAIQNDDMNHRLGLKTLRARCHRDGRTLADTRKIEARYAEAGNPHRPGAGYKYSVLDDRFYGAIIWFNDDQGGVGSFVELCDELGISPERARRLVDDQIRAALRADALPVVY